MNIVHWRFAPSCRKRVWGASPPFLSVSMATTGSAANRSSTGSKKFGRKFTGENKESDLLRLIFLHLAGELSLRTTVAEAREAGIVDIVDVTLSNHFIRALLPAEFSLRFVLKNWNKVKLKLTEHTRKRVSASARLKYIAFQDDQRVWRFALGTRPARCRCRVRF